MLVGHRSYVKVMIGAIAVAALIGTWGCSKDDDPVTPELDSGSFDFSINGVDARSQLPAPIFIDECMGYVGRFEDQTEYFSMMGVFAGGDTLSAYDLRSIMLTIAEGATLQTGVPYSTGDHSYGIYLRNTRFSEEGYISDAESGAITLTQLDRVSGRFAGTFQMTMHPSGQPNGTLITISSGVFHGVLSPTSPIAALSPNWTGGFQMMPHWEDEATGATAVPKP